MSFAFLNCRSTLLHYFKETEREGGKKPETLGRPGLDWTGLDYLFFSFVLFCFFVVRRVLSWISLKAP